MILTVGNTKGGVGKTTIALNIAVARALAGRDVWLVDADTQGTAQEAIAVRSEAGQAPVISCAHYPDGSILRTQVKQNESKFDDVIIDAGGRDTKALRAAIFLSDVLLVPFQPRSYDVWALDNIAAIVDEAMGVGVGLVAYTVLNRADTAVKATDNAEAADAVAELPQFKHLATPIYDRKAFANEAGQGLSVLEGKRKDQKAVAELNALIAALF